MEIEGDVGQIRTVVLDDVFEQGIVEQVLSAAFVDETDQDQLISFDSDKFLFEMFDERLMRFVEICKGERVRLPLETFPLVFFLINERPMRSDERRVVRFSCHFDFLPQLFSSSLMFRLYFCSTTTTS